MPSPSERLDQESWARRAERELRVLVESQKAEIDELKKLLKFYGSAREEPIRVPKWRAPTESKKNVGTVVGQMTDWHLDEVVKPETILGMNAYNREIAHQRIQRWVEKLVSLPREYMQGLDIQGLVIPSTGDLFTGEIHAELTQSNEDRLLASMLYWMEPVIAMVELLEREYSNVEIDCVVGNHTRLAQKMSHKDRVHDNVEWLFWSIVRDRLADRGSNVVINVSPSASMNVEIYGRNHFLDHGYEFKGGTGISGAFSPLMLGAHRTNLRQSVAEMPMETMVIGHLHQIINIPGVKMGGTLKGYDEFAFDLKLRPDANGAGQAMWVTAPERAEVLWMPIYVTDEKSEDWGA